MVRKQFNNSCLWENVLKFSQNSVSKARLIFLFSQREQLKTIYGSGGSRISPKWGAQHQRWMWKTIIWPIFPKNCMELKGFGLEGTRSWRSSWIRQCVDRSEVNVFPAGWYGEQYSWILTCWASQGAVMHEHQAWICSIPYSIYIDVGNMYP